MPGKNKKRIMALDFGAKTIGCAVTDALFVPHPVGTCVRKRESALRDSLRQIDTWIREYEITEIVVGYPLHMNGTAGERAQKSEAFAEMLKTRTGLPVFLWDERLTTIEADEILAETEVPPEKRKTYIDAVAACLILEDYMGAGSGGEQ